MAAQPRPHHSVIDNPSDEAVELLTAVDNIVNACVIPQLKFADLESEYPAHDKNQL